MRNKHAGKYLVLVADNFHYMDEGNEYELGRFATSEEAKAACRRIVDEYLVKATWPYGTTAEDMFRSYAMYGQDPYIVSSDENCRFSAWTYAKSRCEELCRPSVAD